MLSVVFVLSCGGSGYYPEQCLLSLHTLRKFNPDLPAHVLIDCMTHDCLKGNRLDALASYAEILKIDVPPEFNTDTLRSRYLKTSIRNRISGDFIFLDCDTIVCRPFSLTDFNDVAIGMVADLNAPLLLTDENTIRKCQNAGFPDFSGLPYFNSGFFFVKDVPIAYRLFEFWHQLWCNSVQNGCSFDQPALCEANRQLGFPIKEVSGTWNCQIHFKESRRFLNNASVLHYFAGGTVQPPMQEEALFKRVRASGIDSDVDFILSGSNDALTAFFCQKTDQVLRFLGTDLFSVFSEDIRTFRRAERFATIIRKIKQAGHTFLLKRK